MMAIGLMNMAGSCSSCYVTTGKNPLDSTVTTLSLQVDLFSHLNTLSRVILSICCKLQRWSTNRGLKHRDGIGCACDTPFPHAAVLLYPQCHIRSNHHNGCDRANWLPCCIPVVESRQAWFPCLCLFLLWCSLHFRPVGSWPCRKFTPLNVPILTLHHKERKHAYGKQKPLCYRLEFQFSKSSCMSQDQTQWFWGTFQALKYITIYAGTKKH